MPVETDNLLGTYLKDRRTRLDPAALGFPAGRRRTPGLRREEVAQRANISPTWYTWLEQGRGGAPSADVLESNCRCADADRHRARALFLLGLGRPPEVRYKAAEGVTPRYSACSTRWSSVPPLSRPRHGSRRLESRRRCGADRLWCAPARATQYPAPHLRQLPRPRCAARLGKHGPFRGRSIPGGCGARRRRPKSANSWTSSAG